MRKIRIAEISINEFSHAKEVWKVLTNRSDVFDLAGYALPEGERERTPKRVEDLPPELELSLDEILNDPTIEAVAIEPDETHLTKYAIAAAKAGKHIHMEKPGGLSLADFEELIRIVKEKNLVFHVGYMYRYNPYVIQLLNDIKEGKLGEILSVEAQMNCTHSDRQREWLKRYPGGMMFFLGCHLIDLIYQIMGEPEKVYPFMKSTDVNGIHSDDLTMTVLEYKNGLAFAKTSNMELGGFERRQLVVSGTQGTVELKPIEWYFEDGCKTRRFTRMNREWLLKTDEEWCEGFNRYAGMLTSFAEMVRGEKQNPYTPDYELALYKLLLKCCGNEKGGRV